MANVFKSIREFITGTYRDIDIAYSSLYNFKDATKYTGLGSAIHGGYLKSDLVYSIVSKKGTTGARAQFAVYSIRSLKAYKDYQEYLTQKNISLKELIALKQNAIEPKKHYLNEKFANPNDELSGSEYTEALLVNLNLTGNAYEQAVRKGKRGDILQLYPMPPQCVKIKTDGKYPVLSTGYALQFDRDIDFDKEEVIHTKYYNPAFNYNGSHLYGLSPVQVAWNVIRGDDEGFSALSEIKENRGPRTIVSIDNDKVRDYAEGMAILEKMKEEFQRRSMEFRDTNMPMWGNVGVHKIGLSSEDLDILNTSQVTFDRLCNIWHVPVEWFNSQKQSKYNNLEQYNKQAIINGIIPDLNKIRDSRNKWARKYGIITQGEAIDYDPTVFTELDIDKKAIWDAIKDAPFTKNEQRIFLGENALNDELMDKVYINRNMIPIELAGKVNLTNNNDGQNNDNGNDQDQGQESDAGNSEGVDG